MVSASRIEELINEFLDGSEFFLVDLQVKPGNEIMIELDGDQGIGIDDCVKVSREVESSLDRETQDFSLNVSSAGLGQPLKLRRQYQKNLGREVKVTTTESKELKGRLTRVDDEGIEVLLPPSKKKKLPERPESVSWDEVRETKVKVVFK